mmetsp:Transcript_58377/g.139196  ORF Transcript_58377/g.139196 Transcript_58377/m.139196 type:complete len:230 (+) Transcript_58377:561-1250(+)
MLRIVGTSISDILQDVLVIQTKPSGNIHEPFWSKCALRINIHSFALGASAFQRKLASDAKGVAELRFPAAKLTKDLCNLACLHASSEKSIQLRRPSGQLHHILPHVQHLCCTHHSHWNHLLCCCKDALRFLLANSLDFHQLPLRHESYGFHAVNTVLDESIEVCLGKACTLMINGSTESLELCDSRIISLFCSLLLACLLPDGRLLHLLFTFLSRALALLRLLHLCALR